MKLELDRVKEYLKQQKNTARLVTVLNKLGKAGFKTKLHDVAINDEVFVSATERLLKGVSEGSKRSQKSDLKKLRGVLRDLVVDSTEGVTEISALPQKMPTAKEVSDMSIWEFLEAIGPKMYPVELSDKFSMSTFLRLLGMPKAAVSGISSCWASRTYPTTKTGRIIHKYLSALRPEITLNFILERCHKAADHQSPKSESVINSWRPNGEIKFQIERYIDFKHTGNELFYGNGVSADDIDDHGMLNTAGGGMWKNSGCTADNFISAMNVYFGFLSTLDFVDGFKPDMSMLMSLELLNLFVISRAGDTGHHVTNKVLRIAKLESEADSFLSKYHPLKDMAIIQNGREMFFKAPTTAGEKLVRNDKVKKFASNRINANFKIINSKKSDSDIEGGKKNVPWILGRRASVVEGWNSLKHLVLRLERSFDLSPKENRATSYAMPKLTIATWLSMEMECPLRVGNSADIQIHNSSNLSRVTTPVIYKGREGTWMLYCPKSCLKNSKSSHVDSIDFPYSIETSNLIDKYLEYKAKGDNLFPPTATIRSSLRGTTQEALSYIFPDEDFPGMNPHSLRHIFATYWINQGMSSGVVASLMMDTRETIERTYCTTTHIDNFKDGIAMMRKAS